MDLGSGPGSGPGSGSWEPVLSCTFDSVPSRYGRFEAILALPGVYRAPRAVRGGVVPGVGCGSEVDLTVISQLYLSYISDSSKVSLSYISVISQYISDVTCIGRRTLRRPAAAPT